MSNYVYLATSGVVLPDTSDLLAIVQGEYKAVFGADLVVTADTPQGVLITAETLARSNALENNAALANQINPDIAGGVFLDAIWKLTGGQRLAATYSYITGVTLGGVPNTPIPAGTIAAKADGTQFASVGAVTLDATTGFATVDFVALVPGPTSVNPAALNTVVSGVLGWETVTNANAAVPGTNQESDGASRLRRRNTLALQSVSLPGSIIAGLYATTGVKSMTFRENVQDVTTTIDGCALVAHSIYACVDGGTDAAVAATLASRKSMGANYNNGFGTPVSVNYTDPSSGQVYPVKFDRPVAVPILVRATIKVGTTPGDPLALVQAAILAYATGQDAGEVGFTVGSSVSPFELSGAINVQTPTIYVQKLEVAPASTGVYVTSEIPLTIYQIATVQQSAISVVLV